MTAPVHVRCKCSHAKQRHEVSGFAPQCVADGCTCLNYRPDVPTAKPSTSPSVAPRPAVPRELMSADDPRVLLAAALRSDVPRTVAMAKKVQAELDELRERIRAEKAAVEARAEVERLEAELAAARAKLRPGKPTPPTSTRARDGVCPDCGQGDLANVGVHRSRAHGVKAG